MISSVRPSSALAFLLAGWISLCSAQSPTAPPTPTPPASAASGVEQVVLSRLPPPPDGFSWRIFKNAALLTPVGWHEHTLESPAGSVPMSTYAASPQEFSVSKQFEMGVTVQVMAGTMRSNHVPASKAALLYLKQFLDSHKREDFLILERKTRGDFESTFMRYRDAPAGLKPIIVHKFVLANDVADTVDIFTFESPEDSWTENWSRFGTPIIGKVAVLPNLPVN
jgi:hypothetical protein